MLSRVLCGLGAGVVFAVCPIYMAEIAEDSVRGILGRTTVLGCGNVFIAGYRVLTACPFYIPTQILKSLFSYISLSYM
jgi:MFS family permease